MTTNLIDNRQIRVFISSTFRDMQDERDYLMKRTFPKLRKLAAERDVTLTELDLRWGITEEESKSGKVVEICLREIENSIPFFIGIIGNRYGWVPAKEDLGCNVTERFTDVNKYIDQHLSVTEMEMQFGVLSRKEDMHAYFYIKEQEEDADNIEMLNRLKDEVRKSKYPSTTYSSPENLAMQVEEAFIALLDQLFPQTNLSELEKERIGQRSFMNQLCQNYIKDERNFAALEAWLANEDSRQYVVTGASGLGKSALIANWIKGKLNDSKCKYNIIYHFTGNGGSESNSEHIITSISNEIKDIYSFDEEDSELADLFLKVTSEAKKPLLIVIDAINQIVDVDNAKLLNWLPAPTKNIKILFSTLEDDRTMEVFKNRDYPIFNLQPLDVDRRSLLVKNYLKLYAKTLTDKQVERIVTDSQCENTLVLKTLLDELINFGIYEKLDDRIEYYLKADNIDDFYQTILESYEEEFKEYDTSFVKHILSLISLSRNGLSEDELLSITGIKPLHWSQFYCSFYSNFIIKNGFISFSHQHMSKSIKNRYSDNKWNNIYRKEIIEYLKEKSNDDRAIYEIPFQYYYAHEYELLYAYIININVFDFLYHHDIYCLGGYWRKLISINPQYSIIEYRNQEIPDGDSAYYYMNVASFSSKILNDFNSSVEFNKIVIEELKCSEDMRLDIAYNNIGIALGHLGRYEEAIYYTLKSVNFCEVHKSSDVLSIANSYNNLGTFYNEMYENEKAIECYNKAIDLILKSYGAENMDIARLYDNIGNALSDLGRVEEAMSYYDKAVSIQINLQGKDCLAIASTYNNIATKYNSLGNYDSARDFYTRAMEIYAKYLDLDNIQYLNTFYNNTKNQLDSEQISVETAIDTNEYILTKRINILGINSLDVSDSYQRLGELYYRVDNYHKSTEAFMKSLNIRNSIISPLNDDTRKIQFYLAYNCFYLKDYQGAINHFENILDYKIQKKQYGDEDTIYVLQSIGKMYNYKNDLEQSNQYFVKCIDLLMNKNNSKTKIASIYNDLAWNCHIAQKYDLGFEYIEKSISYNADDYNSLDTLACLYDDIGQYRDALITFNKCLEIHKSTNNIEGIEDINKKIKKILEKINE